MDYGKEVAAMLEHLSENHSAEELTMFVRCMSFGLAQASTYVTTTEAQDELLECVFEATLSEAKALFAESHGMSGAEFLKHHFKPEAFNG